MKANPTTSSVLKGLLLVTSALVASAVLGSTAARAGGPTGGTVVVGSATISSPNSNSTVVNQSTNKALINWDAFSIPSGSSVVFNQPAASSVTVNRVIGPNASAIDGQLLANGNIWLINSNGILFGQGAQVNVGGLLATTSDIDDDDFKSGKFRFSKPSANPDASVVNKGTIVAGQGGSIVLSASRVSNEGVIKADLGSIVLGGARTFTVDLDGDNLIRYQIGDPVTETPKDANGRPSSALVSNSGTLSSSGGTVLMTARAVRNVENNVINNAGVVEANSVSVHNGEVIFDAGPDGTANVGGTVSASGDSAGETGGSISVTGGTVNVSDGAKLDASGDSGGGKIQIGGGLHGQGTIANSQTTNVGKAIITADAKNGGDGGEVSVWSDGQTDFNATVSARGGAAGGNGGLVETSGKNLRVGADAFVDTLAPGGLTGAWLLDPTDINISTSGSDGIGGSNISPATVIAALSSSNVFLEAGNNITVNSAIVYSSSHSLSLFAGRDLTFNASVQNAGTGAITGVGGWDPTTAGGSSLGNAGTFGNSGGSIFLGGVGASGDVSVGSAGGLTRMLAYNLTLDATNGNAQLGSGGAAGGDITVNAIGTLTLSGGISRTAQIGNGSAFGTSSGGGDIKLTASSVVSTGTAYVAGQSAVIALTSDGSAGDVGSAANPLQIAVNQLAVQTDGADAYIASPGSGFSIGTGSDGIDVGTGTLSIVANGAVTQTKAILAGAVDLSATAGSITLSDAGNAFGPATLATTSGNITIYDSSALTITGATVAGDLTLSSAGAIGQTGAIQANALSVTTANGEITLSNTGNAFDTLSLSAGGTHGASIYDTSDLTITGASVATTLSLTVEGEIQQTGAILASTLNATSTGGSITLTDSGNTFNTASLTTSGGDASLYDASALTVVSASVNGALSLSGAADIGQTGAIHSSSLSATSTAGDITLTNSGNAFTSASLSTTGSHDASLYDGSALSVSGATVGGDLTLTGGSSIGQSGSIHSATLSVTASGNIALTNSGNNFTSATLSTSSDASLYDSVALTVASANIGGGLTLSSGGSIDQTGAVTAGTLGVTTTSGAITFTNTGNSFGPLSVSTSGSGNATLFDSADLVVASANVGGTLTLAGGGTISQTGAIHAGALNATATNGAITLNNTGNTINTATLSTDGSDSASLYDVSALTVAGANVGGTLTLTGGASIGQTGAIHAAALNVSTTSGAITLSNAANSFASATIATGGTDNATLNDASALSITGANVGGTLALTSAGSITQTGAIHANALNATSTGGAIVLTNSGNALNTASLTTSGSYNASFYDASNLIVSGASIGGDFTLSGGGTIGQSGAIHTHALSVTTTDGAISLGNTSNTFDTLSVSTSGSDDALFYDASSLSVTSANVGGSLTLTSGGSLTQTGDIHAAALNVTTTGGEIVLTNAGNTFSTAAISTSGNDDASLYDASALTISGATVGGALALSGGGAIGQSGAIHADSLNVSTTGGPITLTNAGNAFDTATLSTSGSDSASLTDSTNLIVASANVGGALTLTGSGSIGQTGAIHAASLNVATTGGPITLTDAGNAFGTATLATAGSGNGSLYDSIDLTIASATVGGTLTLSGARSIGQTGAIKAATLVVSTTGGAIALNDTGNAFGTANLTTSGTYDASLYDSVGLIVSGANIGGDLALSGGGTIGQSGAIHADALSVTTTGGDIALNDAGNTFSTVTVSTSGSDDASFYDLSNLIVTHASVGGDLTLSGAGSIGQTGAILSAALNVTTTGGPIALTNAGNAFNTVSLVTSGSDGASLYDSINLIVSGASVGGDLSLSGGGSIGQTGAIHSAGLNVTTTGGPITLTNTGNTFNTASLSTSGSDDASLYDLSNLVIASANIGGDLTLSGAGSIGQIGAIHAGKLTVVTTGGPIVLTNAGNTINTADLTTSGSYDASLYDSIALVVSAANIGGDLTLSGGVTIGQSGAIHADGLNVTTTNGAITLTNSGNTFDTLTVATSGAGNASFQDGSALTVAGANVGGTLTLSGASTIGQSGAIHAAALNVSTTGGGITLANTANTFATAAISTAGTDDASLYDASELIVTGATVGGTLSLAGGASIGQSGAIHSTALNVTTTGGPISLTNAGNAFDSATLGTSGSDNASLNDSIDLTIGGATVGGTLTLTGGGSIDQTGAIHSAVLNVTATGGLIDLTNTGNVFGTITVSTSGSDDATLYDSTGATVAGATVGGTFELTAGGAVGQTGAIHAAALNVTANGGSIDLSNSGNSFGSATLFTSGDASLYDSASLTIAGANVGGTLALTGAGSIGQSGAIHADTLNVTTTGGPIDLTSSGNTFNTTSLSTAGSDDASIYDAADFAVSNATIGGDLALSGAGSIGQTGAIHASSLTVTTTGGAITLNNSGNAFGTATLTTSGSDNASLYDSIALTVAGADIGGVLTLSGGGAIGQTGAIHAVSLNVSTTNGAIALTDSGNAFQTAALSTSGADDASLYDGMALIIASANIGGDLTLAGGSSVSQSGAIHAATLDVSATNGAITLADAGNTFGTATISTSGSDNATLRDASGLTVASANVGGTLTLIGDNGIGQSGAIHATALDVSTTHGAIQLTDAGNSFATASVSTTGTDDASISDSSALAIAGANVGGNLTLAGGGAIGQTGAIHAASLNVSTAAGTIALTNTGNTFGPVTVATSGSDNASLYDASALVIASANVGGALVLSGGSTVGQTGAIHAASLNVTTTNGAIDLGNTGNTFATATLSTFGSDNATLYDGVALTIASASIGGDLSLSGGSSISQAGAIHAHALNAGSTGGAINLGNAGNTFDMLTVSTAGSSDASFYDASALNVAGANVGGTLSLSTGGALGQSGAIHAAALDATAASGAIALTDAGNSFANASLTTSGSGNASLYDASSLTITSANVGGTLALSGAAAISQSGAIHATNLTVASTGGAITLNAAGNAFNTASVSTTGSNNVVLYDSSSLTLTSANIGGSLTVLSQHDLTFVSSIQANTGLLAVAGWDGTTTNPSSLTSGSAYGNNGGSIVIGGAGAAGDVAIGSKSGTTTVAGANVSLTAANGYAQLGYHGTGTDAVSVYAKGNVTLTGGTQQARFAQIGNGGYQVSGNQSGDIYISAAGDLALNGGAGQAAYAQIGHGGAQGNSGSNGYSDTGLITVAAKTATLAAGSGTGSYAQIGHGGYLSGQSLASGAATLGGNISLTTVSGITLTGGGTAAYAQVGHGGDLVNFNAANGTSGSISGNITATVSTKPIGTDPVNVIAGSGDESYAQIGNGGNGENTPAPDATVDFNVSGNILVSDLRLRGSATGQRGYAQIGGGDASRQGTADIAGDITIGQGFHVDAQDGTAPDTFSLIGGSTGFGTVTGTVTFLSVPPPPPPPPPPPSVGDSGGAIAVVIQKPTEIVTTPVVLTTPTPPPLYTGDDEGTANHGPGPLEQLVDGNSGGNNSEGEQPSDSLSESIGKSLDAGSRKVSSSETLLPGLTRQLNRRPHPVPPADVDYSSWGNEALWL